MKMETRELLQRLGNGDPIAKLCESAGWTRPQFDDWWRAECRKRVPPAEGAQRVAGPRGSIRIERDRYGIPHVFADNDHDVFFGFGYATAQDRLYQLDYLRRKARGILAEILGPEAVESDILYRTAGLAQIADAELPTLPAD